MQPCTTFTNIIGDVANREGERGPWQSQIAARMPRLRAMPANHHGKTLTASLSHIYACGAEDAPNTCFGLGERIL
eukprot:5178629-Amphidinium_carterae.1